MKRLTTRLSRVVLAQTAKKCLGGSRMYGATARKAFGAEGGKSSFSSVEIDELNNALGVDGLDGGFDLATSNSGSDIKSDESSTVHRQSHSLSDPDQPIPIPSQAPAYAYNRHSLKDAEAAYAGSAPMPVPTPAPLSDLTHVDRTGKPTMVNVSKKAITTRTAHARARLDFPSKVFDLILSEMPATAVTHPSNAQSHGRQFKHNSDAGVPGEFLSPEEVSPMPEEIYGAKGPVFATAVVAGTMAVKRTSDLIPFCHPLPIESCDITVSMRPPTIEAIAPNTVEQVPGSKSVYVDCTVSTTGKTGVEMEALQGATSAALYDMLKAVSHQIRIADVRLISKRGGKSDYQDRIPNPADSSYASVNASVSRDALGDGRGAD